MDLNARQHAFIREVIIREMNRRERGIPYDSSEMHRIANGYGLTEEEFNEASLQIKRYKPI